MNGPVPSLVLSVSDPDPLILKEILAGIEEEGVIAEVRYVPQKMDSVTLAYMAAKASSLGTGIGIAGDHVKLSVRDQLAPVLLETSDNPRVIGLNGARYLKGKHLKVTL